MSGVSRQRNDAFKDVLGAVMKTLRLRPLTVNQIASRLGVSYATVYRAIENNQDRFMKAANGHGKQGGCQWGLRGSQDVEGSLQGIGITYNNTSSRN